MKCLKMRIWILSLMAALFAEMSELATAQANKPPNDDFADRIVLEGILVTTNGSNLHATAESGEPSHSGLRARRSVWWSWTAPDSGTVEITTAGSDFDTLLAIYKGATFPSLTLVAANDDWNGSASSRVRFAAVPGQSYQIAVDGKPGSFGNIVLNLRMLTPPNDLFLNATPLIGRSAWVYGTNTDATAEAGEPQHAGVVSTNSVWWIWTAPYSFDVEIETDFFFGNGPEFDTVLAVYVGET